MAVRTLSDPWPAPAKLNLFLHVVGRQADGYHDLQTVFQFVDLCDELVFSLRDDRQIRRRCGAPGVAPADDLVVRAARALQSAAAVDAGADIEVHKRIPVGGGLGGGSSDAATTLIALNRLWNARLSATALADIGLRLGADVPVFLLGLSAFAEGRGERLTPLQPAAPWYLIVKPGCEVSTASVFQAAELTRNTPPMTISDFLSEGGRQALRNDCEPVVRSRYPEVAAALDWLSGYGDARLTGTGSCIFAAFSNRSAARQVRDLVPAPWTGYVARALNRSPLLDR